LSDPNIYGYPLMSTFRLRDFGHGIFSGRHLRREQLSGSGKYLYLNGRNIKDGEFVLTEKDRFFNEEKYNRYILKPGDIVVSRLWMTRKIYQYKESDPPSFLGGNWILLRTEKNEYLSLYLRVKKYLDKFELDCQGRLKGGTIPYLSTYKFLDIEILEIPLEDLQKKYEEEKRSKIREPELLESIKKGNLENDQKNFLYDLIKEHFEDPIIKLSKQHESDHLEFKSSFRKDLERDGTIPESVIIHSVIKTIGGFCNTGGGDLLIGVSDENEIVGIEVDGFDNLDGFLKSINQQIENNTNPNVMNVPDVVEITTTTYENKTICRVNVNPTPVHIFVKHQNKEIFYKRTGPKTVSLEGREMSDYITEKNSMYQQ